MRLSVRGAAVAQMLVFAAACSSTPGEDEPDGVAVSRAVYGTDDRTEYFDVNDPDLQAQMSESMVALLPRVWLASSGTTLTADVPTWGAAAGLCPGERFASEPAAALCTGVLVDWDLVLTAGHCVRALPLDELAVVFGYYYSAPGTLAIDGSAEIGSVVSEALDPLGAEPRLDFAWLRLRHPVGPPLRPAPVRVRASSAAAGDPIIVMATSGGVPLKLDAGAILRDPRSTVGDYFLADSDTFEGGSGGAAFDAGGGLLGVLARGNPDFVGTAAGCNAIDVQADGTSAGEEFTYAGPAVEALCAKAGPRASALCLADCGDPCSAGPAPFPDAAAGCALARPTNNEAPPRVVGIWAAILFMQRRRRQRVAQRTRSGSPGSLPARAPTDPDMQVSRTQALRDRASLCNWDGGRLQ